MGVSFLSVLVPYFEIEFNYVLWGNIGGFSLVTSVLFFYVFYYGNYCLLTKLLPLAMIVINLLNIFGVFYPKYYFLWYEIVVFSLILTVALIIETKRLIKK